MRLGSLSSGSSQPCGMYRQALAVTLLDHLVRARRLSPVPRPEPDCDLVHTDLNQTPVICLKTELRQRDGYMTGRGIVPLSSFPNVSVNKTTTSLSTLNDILDSSLWGVAMNENIARLQAIQNNIARYEGLLKSKLSAIEVRFVEKRLSEEKFALAVVQFMSPSNSPEMIKFPDALQ